MGRPQKLATIEQLLLGDSGSPWRCSSTAKRGSARRAYGRRPFFGRTQTVSVLCRARRGRRGVCSPVSVTSWRSRGRRSSRATTARGAPGDCVAARRADRTARSTGDRTVVVETLRCSRPHEQSARGRRPPVDGCPVVRTARRSPPSARLSTCSLARVGAPRRGRRAVELDRALSARRTWACPTRTAQSRRLARAGAAEAWHDLPACHARAPPRTSAGNPLALELARELHRRGVRMRRVIHCRCRATPACVRERLARLPARTRGSARAAAHAPPTVTLLEAVAGMPKNGGRCRAVDGRASSSWRGAVRLHAPVVGLALLRRASPLDGAALTRGPPWSWTPRGRRPPCALAAEGERDDVARPLEAAAERAAAWRDTCGRRALGAATAFTPLDQGGERRGADGRQRRAGASRRPRRGHSHSFSDSSLRHRTRTAAGLLLLLGRRATTTSPRPRACANRPSSWLRRSSAPVSGQQRARRGVLVEGDLGQRSCMPVGRSAR